MAMSGMEGLSRTGNAARLMAEARMPLGSVPGYLETDGRRTNLATIYRWAKRGIRGVRLETYGAGVLYTSREALARFFDGVEAAKGESDPGSLSDAAAGLKAAGELEKAGI